MAVINGANKQRVIANRSRHTPDLSGFIVRCEANYLLLLKLMPDIQVDDEVDFGLAPLQHTFGYINISVTERCKYTTTVSLTQTNNPRSKSVADDQDLGSEAWLQESTMSIRLYHDARMAEVLSFQKQGRIRPSYEYPNQKMFQRDEKAQLNQFLGEWLNYCLRVGQVLDNPMDNITSSPDA